MISNRMSVGMALLIVFLGAPMKSGQAFQCDNLQRLIKETYNFKPADQSLPAETSIQLSITIASPKS